MDKLWCILWRIEILTRALTRGTLGYRYFHLWTAERIKAKKEDTLPASRSCAGSVRRWRIIRSTLGRMAGHVQFSSSFRGLGIEERRRKRETESNRERWVILAGLPVISRFYSGRLARRGSFSWKLSSSSRTRPARRVSPCLPLSRSVKAFEWVHTRKPRDRTSR